VLIARREGKALFPSNHRKEGVVVMKTTKHDRVRALRSHFNSMMIKSIAAGHNVAAVQDATPARRTCPR
jgi:hypothetical protein